MIRRLAARRPGGDEGIAMIMVMASITVLTLLITAAVGYAMAALPQARHDQDWNAALAAAQSGVDDYIARLNQSDSYWTTVDCTNVALKGGKTGTNSCGWTSATPPGWQLVEPGNAKGGEFHYDVSTAGINSQGVVQVTSTGQVNGVTRTIQVNVGRGGSTDFLYYTDFEDADPDNQTAYPYGASTQCGGSGPTNAKYWWPSGRSGCVEITFVSGDVLDGAVHFNDTPLMSGSPTFLRGFETADPNCAKTPYKISNCSRGGATPNLNGLKAQGVGQLYLPDNSDQFKNFPGCQYTGDTRIKFNSNGTMTVWSPKSVGTSVGAGCGTPSLFGTVSGVPQSQTVPVPTDQVVYVRNAATQSVCTKGQIGDGIPLYNDADRVGSKALSTFYCGNGNLYVEGTLGGQGHDRGAEQRDRHGRPAAGEHAEGQCAGRAGHARPGGWQLGRGLPPRQLERNSAGLRSSTAGSTARSRPCSTASGWRPTTRAATSAPSTCAARSPRSGVASSGRVAPVGPAT